MFYKILFFLSLCFTLCQSCKKSEIYSRNDEAIDSLIIYVPNSFNPDYYGFNEKFKPVYAFGAYKTDSPAVFVKAINNPLKKYEMEIRDEENKIIFFTTDIKEGWNGKFKNKEVQVGPYNVYIHLEGTMAGIKNINSQINLIR